MEGERACANECNYSPLEGVRGVEPSLGEGRVRLCGAFPLGRTG